MEYRSSSQIREDEARAVKYAKKGTYEYLLLSLGFFPNNEEEAEKMIRDIIKEWSKYEIERRVNNAV